VRIKAGLASAMALSRNGGRLLEMTKGKLYLATAALGRPETKAGELDSPPEVMADPQHCSIGRTVIE